MSKIQEFKNWVKHSSGPSAGFIRAIHASRQSLEMPKALCALYAPLRTLHQFLRTLLAWIVSLFYWTPIFKSQLHGPCKRLNLYGGLPFITGPVEITCGNDCRISAATTFSGRTSSQETPQLLIGNNVGIGWQTTIAVGSKVILEDNVRMGGRNFLAGYPGHPISAANRAAGLPDLDHQVGDIILEKDVWLGTGVFVMAGVSIGEGTIVAAGSVVTKSLPSGVLAGGNPARIIKQLGHPELELVR